MDYNKVCEAEEMDFYKRFIPYSKGSPSKAMTFDDQYDRANIVFFSDSHVDFFEKEASLQNVEYIVDFINNSPIKYDAVVHTGDIITPFGLHKKEDSKKRAIPFFEVMKKSRSPFLFSKGNHDLNDWNNLPEDVFTDEDWSEFYLDFSEEKFGMVRQEKKSGAKSTWHYYDIEDKKIRIVALDMQDTDKTTANDEGTVVYHGGVSWFMSNEQMQWVADSALNFDDKKESDWGVIFLLHQLSTSKFHEASGDMLLTLLEAFNEQKAVEIVSTNENPFFNINVKADFTKYKNADKKPHIICMLVGHVHSDIYEVRRGINMIWTLNSSATTVSSDARVARVIGTSTQNAFNVVNIDTLKRKIRIFRYGASIDCHGQGGDRFLPDGIDY